MKLSHHSLQSYLPIISYELKPNGKQNHKQLFVRISVYISVLSAVGADRGVYLSVCQFVIRGKRSVAAFSLFLRLGGVRGNCSPAVCVVNLSHLFNKLPSFMINGILCVILMVMFSVQMTRYVTFQSPDRCGDGTM